MVDGQLEARVSSVHRHDESAVVQEQLASVLVLEFGVIGLVVLILVLVEVLIVHRSAVVEVRLDRVHQQTSGAGLTVARTWEVAALVVRFDVEQFLVHQACVRGGREREIA